MRPNPHSRAVEAIVRNLIVTRDGATYFAQRVWGVSLRDDIAGAHALVGRSCPDFEFVDGRRLSTLLRDGTGLLLDFAREAPLRRLDSAWNEHVNYVGADVTDRLGLCAVPVRPDGFVAWASDTTPDPEDVIRASSRWFSRRQVNGAGKCRIGDDESPSSNDPVSTRRAPVSASPARDPDLLRRLLRAKDRMDAAPHEEWPVVRLARVSGASEAHFARSFRDAFGVPPHRYLLTRRIERAKEMLRDTDLPVTDIAFQTGWESLGTFGRTFRDITGMTPTQLRARAHASPYAFGPVPACFVTAAQRPDLRISVSEKRRHERE